MFFLFNLIVGVVIAVIDQALTGGIISLLYSLAVLLPSLAIGTRRLHDTNKSGWFQLIGLIPIVGFIILIVLFAQAGDPDSNAYGPPPGQARTEPGLA